MARHPSEPIEAKKVNLTRSHPREQNRRTDDEHPQHNQ